MGELKVKVLARNSFFLALANGIQLAAQVIFAALLARYLGTAGFGRFAFVLSVVAFAEAVVRVGASTIVTREVSRSREEARHIFWASILLQIAGGMVVVAVSAAVFCVTDILRQESLGGVVRTAGLVAACTSCARLIADIPVAICRGLDRMHWETAVTAFERTLFLALFVLVLKFDLGFLAIFTAALGSQSLISLLSMLVALKALRPLPTIDRKRLKELFVHTVPLLAFGALWGFHWRFDTVLLQHFHGEHQVGVFSAPFKLLETFRMVPWLLLMAAFPSLARQGQSDREVLKRSYSITFTALVTAGLAATLIVYSTARPVVLSIFSNRFAESEPVLRILSFAIVPLCLNWLFNYMCLCINIQRLVPWMYLAASAVHVPLAFALIPSFKAVGGALSFLASESVLCAVGLWVMGKHLAPAPWRSVAKPAVSAFAAAAVLLLFHQKNIPFGGVVSFAVYCCVLAWQSNHFVRQYTLNKNIDLFWRK
jgi:O-antigen/teichoic acid export membrane protein